MGVYCRGTARIRHSQTGVIHEVDSEKLLWEVIESDQRQMGPEIHYEAAVDHADLGRLTWSLWEYPSGAENNRETDVGNHKIVDNFDYGLRQP